MMKIRFTLFVFWLLGALNLHAQSYQEFHEQFHAVDTSITFAINRIESAMVREVSHGLDKALLPVALLTPIVLYSTGFVLDDVHAAETGLLLATAEAVTYSTVWVVKNIVGRRRPFKRYPHLGIYRSYESSYSFPSGHAAGSSVFATVLSLQYPYWYVVLPSIAFSVSTSLSRLHLGVHYFSDVAVGMLLGTTIGIVVFSLRGQFRQAYREVLPTPQPQADSESIFRFPISNATNFYITPQGLGLSMHLGL